MIEWVLIGAGVVIGGAGLAWMRDRQRRKHNDVWDPLLKAVADRRQGSSGRGNRKPKSSVHRGRTHGDPHPVRRAPRTQTGTRAEADVPLPDTSNIVRLHIGWDQLKAPADLDHVPAVDLDTTSLDGPVSVRADNAAAAARFFSASSLDLIDVRRESMAQTLAVTVRGGYLQLALQGVQAHEATLDRIVQVAAALARRADEVSRGTELTASTP